MHLLSDALLWKFYYIFYINFISEVINIDFWQIWYFDVKDTVWVGLQLSAILMQTVGRFNIMWVAPKLEILEAVQSSCWYKVWVYMIFCISLEKIFYY